MLHVLVVKIVMHVKTVSTVNIVVKKEALVVFVSNRTRDIMPQAPQCGACSIY